MMTSVCPSCGSGKLKYRDQYAACTSCEWAGSRDDVLAIALEADTPDAALAVALQVSQALLYILREKASHGVGQSIVAAGVCDVKDVQALTSLIKAGTLGAHKAILEEAERLGEAAQAAEKDGDN